MKLLLFLLIFVRMNNVFAQPKNQVEEQKYLGFATLDSLFSYCEKSSNVDSVNLNISFIDAYYTKENIILNDTQIKRIAGIYGNINNYDRAIYYYYKYINYCIHDNSVDKNKQNICVVLNHIAYFYTLKADDINAIKVLNLNLDFIKNYNIPSCYPHTYLIYGFASRNRNADEALYYYKKSLYYGEITGNTKYKHYAYNEIGNSYMQKKQNDSAMIYLKKALEYRLKDGQLRVIVFSYHDISYLYSQMQMYDSAYKYMKMAYDIDKQYMGSRDLSHTTLGLANVLLKMGKLAEAKSFLTLAYKNACKANSAIIWRHYYSINSAFYEELGRTDIALNEFKKYYNYDDSIRNIEKEKEIVELQTKYRIAQKDKEIQVKDLSLRNNQEKINRQKNTILFFLLGSIVVVTLLLWIVRLFIYKRKANLLLNEKNTLLEQYNIELQQQKEEILNQRDYIKQQKNDIEFINKNLIDSINYAKNFQKALMPPISAMNAILKDYFILFLPKDIVSGDFYWIHALDNSTDNSFIIAAADCTGHGVPGAFMSVIGTSLLKEAVIEHKITEPEIILNYISENISKILHFQQQEGSYKDSMDIAICKLDRNERNLQFSGALSKIIVIAQNKITEIKGDIVPLGLNEEMQEFRYNLYQQKLQPNSMLYLFSDGFSDQFGNDNRKYLYKNFKKLLFEIHSLPLGLQKKRLLDELRIWQENQPQTDDIMILGINIK